MPADASDTELSLRRFMLALLALGIVGLTTELVLLEHYEDFKMLIPLGLFALAAVAIAWQAFGASRASLRLLQATMVMFVVAGAVGVGLHYLGNLEFQLEIDPSQSHWTLFKKVMHAKAPPALAPGVMAQLGLLGLAYAYRHPVLRRDRSSASPSESNRA